MKISEIVQQAFDTARSKGWWPQFDQSSVPPTMESLGVPEKLMLIVTEVAEAMEDYRVGAMEENAEPCCADYAQFRAGTTHTVGCNGRPGKPTGFPSELADVVIRVADLCGALGIDLEGAVERKTAFNKTRSHKHGGKVC